MRKSRVLILIAAVLVLFAGFGFRYLSQHSMRSSGSYVRGQPSLPRHVLIATQGSPFKDQLVAGLVAQLAADLVYVKVIDVAELAGIREQDWQAIVIVHTWEFGKAPRVVSDFAARLDAPENVIGVATSGSGRETLPGIDAISSASVIDDVPALLIQIGGKIEAVRAKSQGRRP